MRTSHRESNKIKFLDRCAMFIGLERENDYRTFLLRRESLKSSSRILDPNSAVCRKVLIPLTLLSPVGTPCIFVTAVFPAQKLWRYFRNVTTSCRCRTANFVTSALLFLSKLCGNFHVLRANSVWPVLRRELFGARSLPFQNSGFSKPHQSNIGGRYLSFKGRPGDSFPRFGDRGRNVEGENLGI